MLCLKVRGKACTQRATAFAAHKEFVFVSEHDVVFL